MGLNLNWLGLGDLLELGIESQKTARERSKPAHRGGVTQPVSGQLYLKWLPAPMKNNMGIESIKFTREASRAVLPHWAISGGAGVP